MPPMISIRSKAPLRLGLGGGGTDLSPYSDEFGGYVLNTTINMYAYCIVIPDSQQKIQFCATDLGYQEEISSQSQLPVCGKLPLHRGVYNRIIAEFHDGRPLSFQMVTYSDAPPGSGLGSSSTMVVCMLKAYAEWLNLPLGDYDIANLAYSIEREDLQMQGGKQDQYAATFGGINFMEFSKGNRVIVNPLRIRSRIINELQHSLLLYYTGQSRESSKIIAQQVCITEQKNRISIKLMHRMKQIAREMKEAIFQAQFPKFVELLNEGWMVKKQTSNAISNPEIDHIYQYAMQHGASAGRISGAGGGGFFLFYVNMLQRMELVFALEQLGGKVIHPQIVNKGAEAWSIT